MSETRYIYVSFFGIPLEFRLQFPFHPSGSGADYYVLHGNATLLDGSELHAEVAVHMSQTVKEALPTVEEKDTLGPAINAIRKATDTKDIEFIKSTKKQPVQLSSRAFSLVTRKFTFQSPSDQQLLDFTRRKIYWNAKLELGKAWITDPVEALYLSSSKERLLGAAQQLASQGFCKMDGDYATATASLLKQADVIEADMKKALDEINAKHAYERG